MHKKPEIGFVMPGQVEAGERFTINIDFGGAKMERGLVYVMKIPAAGYKDPQSGKTITKKDAKKQVEDLEKESKTKVYKFDDKN